MRWFCAHFSASVCPNIRRPWCNQFTVGAGCKSACFSAFLTDCSRFFLRRPACTWLSLATSQVHVSFGFGEVDRKSLAIPVAARTWLRLPFCRSLAEDGDGEGLGSLGALALPVAVSGKATSESLLEASAHQLKADPLSCSCRDAWK